MDAVITVESRVSGHQFRRSDSGYRPDIDGLRAISIISVVIFHAYQRFFTGGYAGVDVFFVISGYLITKIISHEIHGGSFNVLRFYARRILRIFPALALMLPACLVTGWLILQPQDYQLLGEHTVASVFFVSNIAALLESGYFAAAAASNPLLHLWSLGVEEQFYLVWPGLLVLFLRSRFPAALMVVCFAASLAASVLSAGDAAYFFSPLNRFWELLAGGGLALYEARRALDAEPSQNLADAASVLGLCLICLAIFGFNPHDPYPGWRAMVPVAGATMLIAAGRDGLINRTLLSARPMVWIGLISYPLYIWHWPLLSFSYLHSGVWPGFWRASRLMAVAVILAVLTYRLVERKLRDAPRTRRPMIVAALAAALALIGGIGAGLDADRGVPERFPPIVRALLAIGDPYKYFDLAKEVRFPVCHNVPADRLMAHIPNPCIETTRPLIVLWGDSFSGSLYPGLHALQGKTHFGIAQLTSGNGPPFFTTDRYAANGLRLDVLNSQVLTAIKRLQPDVIIISFMVDGMNGIASPPEAFSQLMASIGRARSLSPRTRFVVVGPFPEWRPPLTVDLIDVMLRPDHPSKLPFYITTGLSGIPFQFDDYFRRAFARTGVSYISSLQILCNRLGCLSRTGQEASDLTAVDFGHLSNAGSDYLVSRIAGEIPFLSGTEAR